MHFEIFYSWQSDLPNSTNRGFIHEVIDKSIKKIILDDDYKIQPRLDKDTDGVSGSPNISQTILEKIKNSNVFVADISIVTGFQKDERFSPNPNVLIELGFAISCLTWDKIILIYNDLHNNDETVLPFDIRQHRRISYTLREGEDKTEIKKSLVNQVTNRLREILNKRQNKKIENIIDVQWQYSTTENNIISKKLILHKLPYTDLERRVKEEIKYVEGLNAENTPNWADKVSYFKEQSLKFLEEINEKDLAEKYLLKTFSESIQTVSLYISNTSSTPTNNIKVELDMPEWVIFTDKDPSKLPMPKKPTMPNPKTYKIDRLMSTVKLLSEPFDFNIIQPAISLSQLYFKPRNSIKNNKIEYTHDDMLLHKHSSSNLDSSIYFAAKPTIEEGIYKISGRVFCIDYEDWEPIELEIEVI